MNLLCGTSGYAHDAWSGSFYPDDLAEDQLLTGYATQLAQELRARS